VPSLHPEPVPWSESLRLHESNRGAHLLDALAEALAAEMRGGADLLRTTTVVVPNRAMERFVEQGLARRLGVAANLAFPRLEAFLVGAVDEALADRGLGRLLDRRSLERRLLAVLRAPERLQDPAVAPLVAWLGGQEGEGQGVRIVEMLDRLVTLYEAYAFSRPELLAAWRRGEDGGDADAPAGDAETRAWQAAVWRAIHGPGRPGDPSPAPLAADVDEAAPPSPGPGVPWTDARWSLPEALGRLVRVGGDDARGTGAPRPRPTGDPAPATVVPARAHLFGFSYLARTAHEALRVLATPEAPIAVYTPNPCREFWEDAIPARRGAAGAPSQEDDNPLLARFGRPGREHLKALVEALPEGAAGDRRFSPPAPADRLLSRVQADLLDRRLEHAAAGGDPAVVDDSLGFWACPSPRREAEAVASAIWKSIRAPSEAGREPLRFSEIAVLYAGDDAASRLPHLEAAFAVADAEIPYHVVDLPLAARSRVVEGALRLVDLLLREFTRPAVLDVLLHPAIRPDGVEPGAWVGLAEALGVLRGRDGDDLAGTVLGQPDRSSFGQAARRLALGSVMPRGPTDQTLAGRAAGLADAAPPGGVDPRLLEAPLPAPEDEAAAAFAASVRGLAADTRRLRGKRRPLWAWGRLLGAFLGAHLRARGPGEEGALRRCLETAAALEDLEADRDGGPPVSYELVAALLRAGLEGLPGERGQHLASGVTVATLRPMRALPFRRVFVLGLEEGRFPGPAVLPSLDLRGLGRRRPLDLTPRDRDLYVFLETLVAPEEQLVLSWVARDAATGEPVAPAEPVAELEELVTAVYRPGPPDPSRPPLVTSPPAARHRDPALRQVAAAVRDEWLAAELAAAEAGSAGQALDLPGGEASTAWASTAATRTVPPLPERQPGEPPPTVSIATLRAFLECPMQGFGRHLLGAGEDDGEQAEAFGREDEPFRPSQLDHTVLLRQAFLAGRLDRGEGTSSTTEPRGRPSDDSGAPPEGSGAEAIGERRLQQGALALGYAARWPPGVLGEASLEEGRKVLAAWGRGIGPETRLTVTRLGPSRRRGVVADDHRPPLVLRLDPARAGGAAACLLVGTTLPARLPRFSGEAPASFVLRVRAPSGAGSERRRSLLRIGLVGWLDHLVRSALGEGAGEAGGDPTAPPGGAGMDRSLHVLSGEGGGTDGREARSATLLSLAPVSPGDARRYLAQLVEDLLGGGPHDFRLPIEAFAEAGPGDDARAVQRAIVDLDGAGACRFGPFPEAAEARVPSTAEIASVEARRVGPYLAHLTLPEPR